MLYRISVIARKHGVSPSTIRRWAKKGLITVACRTLGGHRRFALDDRPDASADQRQIVGYARVSSHDQKADLVRQIERLRKAGCDEVISDLDSGLNCSKPGLRALLRRLLSGRISTLVVLHEDRLLRFGVPIIQFLCSRMGTEFRVMEAKPEQPFEQELAQDVVTLMTVFCARLYGRRAKRRRNATETAPTAA